MRRDPDPCPRRPRARRGHGAGRVHDRPRAVAPNRGAGQSGRLDRHDRPQPRDRPDAGVTHVLADKTALLARLESFPEDADEVNALPDERLALLFTCCHPALALDAQVALTLREVGGLTTRRDRDGVPRAGARRWRSGSCARSARSATAGSRSACRPTRCCRIGSRRCSAVVYLVFNEGYAASSGRRAGSPRPLQRGDPARRSCSAMLMPDEPEALRPAGADAAARRATRRATRPDGELVLLADQDRASLGRARDRRGPRGCSHGPRPCAGPAHQLQAAIAAGHAQGSDPATLAAAYEALLRLDGSPVARLNHAVAVALAGDLEGGLSLLEAIPGLDQYRHYHSARADLLRRLERPVEARAGVPPAPSTSRRTGRRSAFSRRRLGETKPDPRQ